jgi:hypothetical protein
VNTRVSRAGVMLRLCIALLIVSTAAGFLPDRPFPVFIIESVFIAAGFTGALITGIMAAVCYSQGRLPRFPCRAPCRQGRAHQCITCSR